MILETLHLLLIVAVLVLVVLALLSPLESLRWWAGWSDNEVASTVPAAAPESPPQPLTGNERYIVWLSGIGSVPGETEDPLEVRFLRELHERVAHAVIVDDAFAYSVRDNPLAGKRLFDRVWRSARSGKSSVMLGSMVQLRNTLQVAVSADGRYGPIYNLGLAQAIVKRLTVRGYTIGSGTPVTLIGYSGGGQVAVGAARYLKAWLAAPIKVISIGGVIAADPGLESIDHLYHVQGTKDPFPAFGCVMFVGRWPVIKYSYWNKAVNAGKVTTIHAGAMGHMAESGYFGTQHINQTATIVADLLNTTRP